LGGTKRIGYEDGYAAVSPIYCAPEIYIKLTENPTSFDVFSTGLILCQLIFNLLDERTDVGFVQHLKSVNYELDTWLENELRAKLRPVGLENGLVYFSERRGLWTLMKGMLKKDPMKRISSIQALKLLKQIIALQTVVGEEIDDWEVDGSSMVMEEEIAVDEEYFETVMESFDSCTLLTNLTPENMPRPLHFLASFKKGLQVGLILAEASEVINDGTTLINGEWDKWQRATQNSIPGEVFVKGWESYSQAGLLGIFEVGDRLRGVGELPFVDGGFEQAINLINRQPKGGSLKLHFDRIPTPKEPGVVATTTKSNDMVHNLIKVVDQGAWKSGGRRGNQEDAFVLHEIRDEKNSGNILLLSGVFDGHAGTAASETVSHILPPLFTTNLLATDTIRNALEKSWDTTCNTYRNGCDENNGECLATYDPINGILYAQTGSKDLVAGTTATIAVMSLNPSGTDDELTILNCGDSRTLVIGQPPLTEVDDSVIVFATRDHSPDDSIEIERLEQGQAAGFDYSIPQCSVSNGSYMVVGDYQYALCRSLEGSFVTSKGIVSDPDITTLNLANSLAGREYCALVLACDGLFEVMDNEEVGNEVIRMRQEGYMAGDIAKNLCGQALKKGSYDNLSVIVIYLDKAV
jgi:serine/threonine protein phosphatase PrpC